MIFESYDYDFPVVGIDVKGQASPGVFYTKNIFGTAFNIGGDYFMTAGHSLRNVANDCDAAGIGFVSAGKKEFLFSPFEANEIVLDFDVGFVKVKEKIERAKCLPWDADRIPSLYGVVASGYPYALDPEERTIGTRSFKGYIVGRRPFSRLTAKPWVYEVSFQSPIGLSGAALITDDEAPRVVGIIIGNHSTRILVFTDSETIAEAEKGVVERETIVERYDSLQLGIAVQSISLLNIESKLLGGTLSDHLTKYGLLGKTYEIVPFGQGNQGPK